MNDLVERVETSTGGHWYRCPKTNTRIAGVTTVLNTLPKEALDNWKLRKAVTLALKGEKAWKECPDSIDPVSWLIEAGDREANAKARIGTGAHDFAEKYLLGKNPDINELPAKEKYHAECFLNFVRDQQPKPVLVEKVVTYIDPKTEIPLFCGTMDMIADLPDGYTWMIDWKSSSSQPRPSHALQAAAYAHSTHWLDEDGVLHPMPKTDRSAVVLLNGGTPERGYRWYRLDDSDVVFSVFKSLLRIHNFSKIENRLILGELD